MMGFWGDAGVTDEEQWMGEPYGKAVPRPPHLSGCLGVRRSFREAGSYGAACGLTMEPQGILESGVPRTSARWLYVRRNPVAAAAGVAGRRRSGVAAAARRLRWHGAAGGSVRRAAGRRGVSWHTRSRARGEESSPTPEIPVQPTRPNGEIRHGRRYLPQLPFAGV